MSSRQSRKSQKFGSSSSIGSHLSFSSLFRSALPSQTSQESPQKKGIFSFFNKKQVQVGSVKNQGLSSGRVDKTFRHAEVPFRKDMISICYQLVEEEKLYAAQITRLVDLLMSYKANATVASLIDALKKLIIPFFNESVGRDAQMKLITATEDLIFNASVDHAIACKAFTIEDAYLNYLKIFGKLQEELLYIQKHDVVLGFALDGLKESLHRPFQRLLEYRYFLRKILKYGEHKCPECPQDAKCPQLSKSKDMNGSATKILSRVIEKCYNYFGLKDNFNELTKWEDKLDTESCRSIRESQDLIKCELHLSIPYANPKKYLPMPVLPSFVASECFEIFPVDSDLKIELIGKGSAKQSAEIHLFTDFMIICSKGPNPSAKLKLLYCPIPLSKISLDYYLDCQDHERSPLYCLKLSNSCMIILKPTTMSSFGEFHKHFQRLKDSFEPHPLKLANDTAEKEPSSIEKRKLESDHEMIKLFKVDEVQDSDTLFEETCRPHLLVSNGSGGFEWNKLTKSILLIKRAQSGQSCFSLLAEGTLRPIMAVVLNESTDCSVDSPRQMRLNVIDDEKSIKRYIIKVGSQKRMKELNFLMKTEMRRSLDMKFLELIANIHNDEIPNWVFKENLDFMSTTELNVHKRVMIRNANDSVWNILGGADSFLVSSGFRNLRHSRIYLKSHLNPAISFLELDLGTDDWSIRLNEEFSAVIRIFRHHESVDYYISSYSKSINEDFVSNIHSLGVEARFLRKQEAIENERQQRVLREIEEKLKSMACLEEEVKSSPKGEIEIEDKLKITLCLEKQVKPSPVEELDSEISLVNTVTPAAAQQAKEMTMEPSKSSSSLTKSTSSQEDSGPRFLDIELDTLLKCQKSREKETKKLYEQFCALHDEKNRLKLRIKVPSMTRFFK